MPDVKCEVFSKVLATLSETVIELIPGGKQEFLTNHLKPANVEILTHTDENVVCLLGSLENIIESQCILSQTFLPSEEHLPVVNETKIEHIATEVNFESPKVLNESTELDTNDCEEEAFTGPDNDTTVSDEVESKDFETGGTHVEISDIGRTRKVTKSGRLVKVPLKLSSDENILVKDEGNVDDVDENIDDLKIPRKKKRGRPQKWFVNHDNDNNGLEVEAVKNSYDDNVNDQETVESHQETVATDGSNDKTVSVETLYLNKNHKKMAAKHSRRPNNLPADMKHINKYYEDRLPYKYFCKICSFRSKRDSHFTAHMNLHKRNPNLKLHQCNKCDFSTVRLSVLQRHKMSHITDTKQILQCKLCDFTTTFKKCFVTHQNKHLKVKPVAYYCNYCNFSTAVRKQYSKHLLKHSENEAANVYQCPKCDYQTKRKINFVRHHSDKHSDVRPHLCDLCGAAFKRTDALHAHKECHIEKSLRVLPFVCKLCQKGFRTMAHLVEHKAVHSTERSFQCHICGQMFKTKAVQQRHLRGVHHKTNVDQCHTCKRFFSSKYTLKRHLRQHEGENLSNDGQIKTIQTLMPEGQQAEFVGDQGQIAADEDANAIQTITISSENINDLNLQKLQNLTSQIQTIGDIPDVYIQGLENVDGGETVSIVNLNGEDIGHILIPSSEPEYTEHVSHLTIDSTAQNIDTTSQQVNSDTVKLFQSLQQSQVVNAIASSTGNLTNDSSLNIQLVSLKQNLSQLGTGAEIVTTSDLANQVQNQINGAIQETVDVPTGQLLDIQGQIITDSEGQIVEVVTPDGNTYHLQVNTSNGGNILSLENAGQDL